MNSEKLLAWFNGINPLTRRLVALALVGAGFAAALLLGPLHGVFNGAKATGRVEYGSEDVRVEDYIKAADDTVSLSATGSIDTMQVGPQSVEVTLSKWFISNPSTVDVVVADTQAPTVAFKADVVKVEIGDKVTPANNVASVSDPVDGELSPVEEEPEAQGSALGLERFYDEGWYLPQSAFVAKEAGKRDVTVTAVDQYGNRTDATYQLEVIDPLEGVKVHKIDKVVEYGKDKVDAVSLVTCTDDETEITADALDATKIGKKVVDYTLTKHKSTRTIQRTFYVRDSQPPVIEIVGNSVEVPQYETYDPNSNIVRVEDPVDGSLNQQQTAPEAKSDKIGRAECYDEGWYTITGDVDVNTLGSYPVTVTACDKHGNEVSISFAVTVVDPLANVTLTGTTTVEYGLGTVNPASLVTCSDPTVSVTAPALDISSTGSKAITFTLTKGRSTRTADITFEVRDTQAPTLTLRNDSVTLKQGTAYDPLNNVVSASDPVDGALTRVSSVPSRTKTGWWTVTGSYNLNKAGRYTLQAVACDRNGNRSTRNFTLTVTAS